MKKPDNEYIFFQPDKGNPKSGAAILIQSEIEKYAEQNEVRMLSFANVIIEGKMLFASIILEEDFSRIYGISILLEENSTELFRSEIPEKDKVYEKKVLEIIKSFRNRRMMQDVFMWSEPKNNPSQL